MNQIFLKIFLQRLDLQGCTVRHLKDLIHISLKLEAQSCGMTFNICYVGLIFPYLISYRGKWVYLFCNRWIQGHVQQFLFISIHLKLKTNKIGSLDFLTNPKGSIKLLRAPLSSLKFLMVLQGFFEVFWVSLGSFGFVRVPKGS